MAELRPGRQSLELEEEGTSCSFRRLWQSELGKPEQLCPGSGPQEQPSRVSGSCWVAITGGCLGAFSSKQFQLPQLLLCLAPILAGEGQLGAAVASRLEGAKAAKAASQAFPRGACLGK